MEYLKNGDKGKDTIEKGTGIGHQWLLVIHEEGSDEQLGGGQTAPGDGQASQHEPHQTPGTTMHTLKSQY
jgi:hypothetical protein